MDGFLVLRGGLARRVLRTVACVGAMCRLVSMGDVGIGHSLVSAMLAMRRGVSDAVVPVAAVDIYGFGDVCCGAVGHRRDVCRLGDVC